MVREVEESSPNKSSCVIFFPVGGTYSTNNNISQKILRKVQTFNLESRKSGIKFLIVGILKLYLVYDFNFNNPV